CPGWDISGELLGQLRTDLLLLFALQDRVGDALDDVPGAFSSGALKGVLEPHRVVLARNEAPDRREDGGIAAEGPSLRVEPEILWQHLQRRRDRLEERLDDIVGRGGRGPRTPV